MTELKAEYNPDNTSFSIPDLIWEKCQSEQNSILLDKNSVSDSVKYRNQVTEIDNKYDRLASFVFDMI